MNKIGLKFSNAKQEEEFNAFNRVVATPYLLCLLAINLGVAISILAKNGENASALVILVTITWGLVIIFNKKLKKWFDIIMLVSCGAFIFQLLSVRRNSFANYTPDTSFLRGYNFGLVHKLNQQGFSRVELILILEIVLAIAKIIYLPDADDESIWLHVAIAGCLLAMRLNEEISERRLFKKFYDSRESLEKFKNLMDDFLPTSIVVIDKKLENILFSNSEFKKQFNCEDSEVMKRLQEIKIDPDDDERMNTESETKMKSYQDVTLKCLIAEEIKRSKDIFSFSKGCIYAEGEKQASYFNANAFSFTWDGKDAVAITLNNVSHQRDILSLKMANDNKEKAISTVAHELRNPVNGLLGMVQIMEKQTMQPTLLKSISLFKTTINLLLSILNSILDLQQINANKLKLNPTKLKLFDVLHTVQLLFEFQCAQKNLDFKLKIDPSVPKYIFTDRERLSQVLINLCANAYKFTFKGGISLGVQLDPKNSKKLLFSVSDTGIGIKEEDVGKLFKMFGKLDNCSALNHQGVGLGLMISNSLVKVLNNNEDVRMEVESKYGEGSTFKFSIPIIYSDGEQDSSLNEIIIAEEQNDGGSLEDLTINHRIRASSLLRVPIFGSSVPSPRLRGHFGGSIMSDTGIAMPALTLPLLNNSKTVLIVDDNAFNVLVVKQLIEDQGLSASVAYHGEDAINQVEKLLSSGVPLSLIFMDCEMPIMDGMKAASILKEKMIKGEMPNIPIVGLSANDSKDVAESCLAAGMDEYIRKPLKQEDLISTLRKYSCI